MSDTGSSNIVAKPAACSAVAPFCRGGPRSAPGRLGPMMAVAATLLVGLLRPAAAEAAVTVPMIAGLPGRSLATPVQQQSEAGRQREAQFRAMLWGYALPRMGRPGGAGMFSAPLNSWRRSPSGNTTSCGSYSNAAACNAYRNGDRWAADRLQNNRSSGSERAWYDR